MRLDCNEPIHCTSRLSSRISAVCLAWYTIHVKTKSRPLGYQRLLPPSLCTRMAFFSSEAEMALLAPDDSLAHLYPSSTCQSSPSIMYSPPLHHMSHSIPTTLSANGEMFTPPHPFKPMMETPYPANSLWSSQSSSVSMAQVSAYAYPAFTSIASGPTVSHDTGPFPPSVDHARTSRSHSASSSAGVCIHSTAHSEASPPSLSRSLSPSSPDLRAFGIPHNNGTWRCAYPGCTSKAVFSRRCDLRKHHKRHTKSFFCRHTDCPQSSGGGFSSKKDLARHEAKHNPDVGCDWDGCDRVFSRVDNMVRIGDASSPPPKKSPSG